MTTQTIYSELKNKLLMAQKNRDMLTVETLKSVISRIDNATAVQVDTNAPITVNGAVAGATKGVGSTEMPRRVVDEQEILKIIDVELAEMKEAIEMMRVDGQGEYIEGLNKMICLLESLRIELIDGYIKQ